MRRRIRDSRFLIRDFLSCQYGARQVKNSAAHNACPAANAAIQYGRRSAGMAAPSHKKIGKSGAV